MSFKDSLSVQSVGYHSAGLFGSRLDTAYSRLVPFTLGNDTLGALALDIDDPGSKSILGMRYLKNYRMVLNWQNQKIYLTRKRTLLPSLEKRFGFSPFLKDSTLIVGVVVPTLLGLQKARAIALNDTILQINNLDVSYANPDVFCQVINGFSASDTLAIRLKNKGDFLLVRQMTFEKLGYTSSK